MTIVARQPNRRARSRLTRPKRGLVGTNLIDFFISYTGIDKAWAEWIGWVWEDAGFSVVLQDWDFQGAGNFVLDMHRAATEANQTIAVLSPEYLGSAFCSAEWAAAFAKDPDGLRHYLLPVRVRECRLNGLWTAITHVDLVGLSESNAEERLLSRVQGSTGKPSKSPNFLDSLSAQRSGIGRTGSVEQLCSAARKQAGCHGTPTRIKRGHTPGQYSRMRHSAGFLTTGSLRLFLDGERTSKYLTRRELAIISFGYSVHYYRPQMGSLRPTRSGGGGAIRICR